MPVYDEDDKVMKDLDGFPDFSVTRGYAKKEEKKKERIPSFLKKIPVLSIIIIILILILGGAVCYLLAKVTGLSAEINEIRAVRGQLSTMQSGFDSAMDAANKEKSKLKAEIGQLHNEIEAMKAQQRRQAEVARERQAAAEARKKAAPPAKKAPPKR